MAAKKKRDGWRSRIVAFDPAVDPEQLLAHPLNATIHPTHQQQALVGSLETIGWIDAAKVNVTNGMLVDGHDRVQQAISVKE